MQVAQTVPQESPLGHPSDFKFTSHMLTMLKQAMLAAMPLKYHSLSIVDVCAESLNSLSAQEVRDFMQSLHTENQIRAVQLQFAKATLFLVTRTQPRVRVSSGCAWYVRRQS